MALLAISSSGQPLIRALVCWLKGAEGEGIVFLPAMNRGYKKARRVAGFCIEL